MLIHLLLACSNNTPLDEYSHGPDPTALIRTPPGQTLSPDALSPDALSPDALSPDALSPDALSPDALSPDALSPQALAEHLGLERLGRVPPLAQLGEALPYPGYSVTPLLLSVAHGYQVSAVLWLPQGPGPHPGVLMAHGHFGQGKASAEAQGPAHVFAHNGYAVLAIDTPGVEEGDRPGRQIHFVAGGANRMTLAASGSSAMAAQLRGLQAGLDYLEARADVGAVAVTGASGGAVQAAYLSVVEPSLVAAVMASPVGIPHGVLDGGCLCDVVAELPHGPDLWLQSLQLPSLWMLEQPRDRPAALPDSAAWVVVPGPHGYEPEMIAQALAFLSPILGGGTELLSPLPNTPANLLESAAPLGSVVALLIAEPSPASLGSASPGSALPMELSLTCAPGTGVKVAVLGVEEPRLPSGMRGCQVSFSEQGPLEAQVLLAGGDGAGTLGQALAMAGVRGVLARGPYGPAAVRSGLPYAVVNMPAGPGGQPWYAGGPGPWPLECAGCTQSLEQALGLLSRVVSTAAQTP